MRFSRFTTAVVLVAMSCAQQELPDDSSNTPDETPSDGGSSSGKSTGGGGSKAGGTSSAGQANTVAGTPNGGTGGSGGVGGAGGSGGKASGGTAGKASGGGGAGGKASGGAGAGGAGGAGAGAGGKASGGTGGSAGGTGGGGGSGGTCKQSSGAPVTGLSLRYESQINGASDTSVGAKISISNTSAMPFNLADLRVRYYLTNEVSAPIMKSINWAWLYPGSSDLKPMLTFDIVDMTCLAATADTYFEFTFAANAGTLAANGSVVLSFSATNTATQFFNQNNDFSFNAGQSINNDYPNVVLMQKNLNKLWGTEP